MAITIVFLSILLTGLVLLAVGIVVLIKSKNKLAGWILTTVGLVFTIFSICGYLWLIMYMTIQG